MFILKSERIPLYIVGIIALGFVIVYIQAPHPPESNNASSSSNLNQHASITYNGKNYTEYEITQTGGLPNPLEDKNLKCPSCQSTNIVYITEKQDSKGFFALYHCINCKYNFAIYEGNTTHQTN